MDDPRFLGVIFDECHHDTGADKTYEMLDTLAARAQIMLGLTATPFVNERSATLFGDGRAINFILDYSLMHAIIDGVVRVPQFKYLTVASSAPGEASFANIANKGKFLGQIQEIIFESVHRKGIIWFSSTEEADKWYEYFRQNINDIEFLVDHSGKPKKESESAFEKFAGAKSDVVMIAVDRYREGIDIQYLSFVGIFGTGRHDIRVLIQSMGRITRLDPDDPSPVFYEFTVSGTPEKHASMLREKMADYYQALRTTFDARGQFNARGGVRCEGNKVFFDNGRVSIVFEFIGELNTVELFKMDGKSLAEWMSVRLGGSLSWDRIRAIFAERGIKDETEARKFLETCGGEYPDLFRWWEIAVYQFVDWNDLLGRDMSGYYRAAEEARTAIKKLVKQLTPEEAINNNINYIYDHILRTRDPKLPPNIVETYNEKKSMRDYVVINYEDYY